jgi:hypothetical protein
MTLPSRKFRRTHFQCRQIVSGVPFSLTIPFLLNDGIRIRFRLATMHAVARGLVFLLHGARATADSSVALAFTVGRGYEATDAAKRLKFGASPTDGVAETGISAPFEPELSLRAGGVSALREWCQSNQGKNCPNRWV